MARLDTGWHVHPRVLSLGLAAMGLHAWSISYCDHARSNGFIPMGAWPALPGIRSAVMTLHQSGLWEVCDGGYRLHDYLDYNRSREQIDAYTAAKQAAGQAGGQASASARAQANGKQTGKQTLKQNPTPGPGPGFNTRLVGQPVGPERGLGETNGRDLPDEVLARLAQPAIADQPTNRPGL
jgi:hypothetical protein